jgi:hypothetical protein
MVSSLDRIPEVWWDFLKMIVMDLSILLLAAAFMFILGAAMMSTW